MHPHTAPPFDMGDTIARPYDAAAGRFRTAADHLELAAAAVRAARYDEAQAALRETEGSVTAALTLLGVEECHDEVTG